MSRVQAARWGAALAGGALLVCVVRMAAADSVVPPWTDPEDVPLPPWAKSAAPLRSDVPIMTTQGRPDLHRGTTDARARLPLFGAKRGAGCGGRWLLVGPMAWVCSDAADLSPDPPRARAPVIGDDGLPYRYYFVGADGAEAYLNLPTEDGTLGAGVEGPEESLDPGFSVAVVETQVAEGQKWGRTTHQKWIPMRELAPFRPSPFHGEETANGSLDFGWVTADTAVVYPGPQPRGKAVAKKSRFERVAWREERAAPGGGGAMVRISDDGASPAEWMRAKDLGHPPLTTPPNEIGGDATARWIDVDLTTQTLVAYEGPQPRYATLVSTGRPPADTPVGVFRIWVKLWSSDMDNLAPEEEEENQEGDRFSIEDVPYVQFFEHGVALHGAFWHRDFGRVHSHGCVNLAPKDAAWLFGFTAPHLPSGWDAVLPTALEPGTVVQVRGGQPVPATRGHGAVGH